MLSLNKWEHGHEIGTCQFNPMTSHHVSILTGAGTWGWKYLTRDGSECGGGHRLACPVVTGHPLNTSTFLTGSWAKSDLLYPIGGKKAPLQIWVECHELVSLFGLSTTNWHLPVAAKSLQSCLTLCDPRDGSPPDSPVPGILQARTLDGVAISFSNAWKWKVKVKSLSRVRLLVNPWTTAHQAPPSMGFSRQEYWRGVPSPSPWHLPINCKLAPAETICQQLYSNN